jgi:hypothetical protein
MPDAPNQDFRKSFCHSIFLFGIAAKMAVNAPVEGENFPSQGSRFESLNPADRRKFKSPGLSRSGVFALPKGPAKAGPPNGTGHGTDHAGLTPILPNSLESNPAQVKGGGLCPERGIHAAFRSWQGFWCFISFYYKRLTQTAH